MHGEEVPLFIQWDGSSELWICIFTSAVYTVKKVSDFPVPDPGIIGKSLTFFLLCIAHQVTTAFSSTRGLIMREKMASSVPLLYSSNNFMKLH